MTQPDPMAQMLRKQLIVKTGRSVGKSTSQHTKMRYELANNLPMALRRPMAQMDPQTRRRFRELGIGDMLPQDPRLAAAVDLAYTQMKNKTAG